MGIEQTPHWGQEKARFWERYKKMDIEQTTYWGQEKACFWEVIKKNWHRSNDPLGPRKGPLLRKVFKKKKTEMAQHLTVAGNKPASEKGKANPKNGHRANTLLVCPAGKTPSNIPESDTVIGLNLTGGLPCLQVSLGLVHGRASHIIWPPHRWQRITPSLPGGCAPLLHQDQDD